MGRNHMFYFLLILGLSLILLGLMLRRKEMLMNETDASLTAILTDVHSRRGMDYENTELASDLTDRMEELEKTLFEQLLKWQVEKEELIEKLEVQGTEMPEEKNVSSLETEILVTEEMENKKDYIAPEKSAAANMEALAEETAAAEESLKAEETVPEKKPVPDNIKVIMDYEEQGLSVQEIAKITRMKKGEVLLLRNLSKHYKK